MARGASMTTDKHVDPAAPVVVAEEEDSDATDVPEGTVRFELDPDDIAEALAAPSLQVRLLGQPHHPEQAHLWDLDLSARDGLMRKEWGGLMGEAWCDRWSRQRTLRCRSHCCHLSLWSGWWRNATLTLCRWRDLGLPLHPCLLRMRLQVCLTSVIS
jgi:hypothetical protein